MAGARSWTTRGRSPGTCWPRSAALPLVLFAHSMGSFVAQRLMAEHGSAYRGVVLCGTNGPPGAQEAIVRGLARAQRMAHGGRHPGTWPERVVLSLFNRPFAPNRTRSDWLSRDDHEVDAFLSDPLCGFTLTAQSWLDFLVGKQAVGSGRLLQQIPKSLPIHVIAGTRDPVGEESRGVQRLLRQLRPGGPRQGHPLLLRGRAPRARERNES